MMRISRSTLDYTLAQINMALGRSTPATAPGSYVLDKDSTGWKLQEMLSSGGNYDRSGRMKTADMALFLRAYLSGISAAKCNA